MYSFTSVLLTYIRATFLALVVLARRADKFYDMLSMLGLFFMFSEPRFITCPCKPFCFPWLHSSSTTALQHTFELCLSSCRPGGGRASHGSGVVLSGRVQPDSPANSAVNLLDRLQRLLAVYRLWLHELRGRLDIAFIEIAGLRSQGSDFQEIRLEVARTFFNFNSRLQSVEDTVESTLEAQSAVLRSFELRWQRAQLVGSLLGIPFLADASLAS